jgi:hypothetical protein
MYYCGGRRAASVLMNSETRTLLDLVSRHLVSLSWVDVASPLLDGSTPLERANPKAFAVSGFVISIRGLWFLVTAGHIVRDMIRRFSDGRRLLKSRLLDCFAGGQNLEPIPFSLELDKVFWLDHDQTGLDFALIFLSPNYVALLEAGGVVALDEPSWEARPSGVDRHVMIGLPSELKDARFTVNSEGASLTVGGVVPFLPVLETDNPPVCLKSQFDRFYAHVPLADSICDGEPVTLDDIDGMSGGPIFAFKQCDDGRWRYWVVAVQSGWARDSRVLAATYIDVFATAVAFELDQCITNHAEVEIPGEVS